jgi:DNA-binding HxlR family transcriptional regulator
MVEARGLALGVDGAEIAPRRGFLRSPASAKLIPQRLREMEDNGIVTRRVVPTSPPSVEYQLTELEGELLPAIQAIAAVGMKLKEKNGKDAA